MSHRFEWQDVHAHLVFESDALAPIHRLRTKVGRPVTFALRLEPTGTSAGHVVDHLDVIAVCPGCHVMPRRHRLPLPPDPRKRVEFTLMPKAEGNCQLSIQFLAADQKIQEAQYTVVVKP